VAMERSRQDAGFCQVRGARRSAPPPTLATQFTRLKAV
jgi:hypothetical protein